MDNHIGTRGRLSTRDTITAMAANANAPRLASGP
jgi:hypothetical protein